MSSSENEHVSSDKEKDQAWVWAKKVEGEKYIRCGFCDQVCSGGITRLKRHLAGTHGGMKPCRKVSKEAKDYCLNALNNFKALKMKQNELLREIGEGCGGSSDSVSLDDSLQDESAYVLTGIGKATQNTQGPMNKFAFTKTQQATLNSAFKKEERKKVCRKIGRFFYNNGIAFNVAGSPYFLSMVDAIAEFGKGLKPPSVYELRTWILKEEVSDMNMILNDHKQYWKNYGCTIMSDGWSDGKGRVLINFLINCPAGCFFLKSIDASELVKDCDTLFKCLDGIVEEVGEDNVIQIITDNASNYKKAGKMLMEKRKKLWWTPCAAHCIDLMLEDISKLKVFADSIALSKQIVKFIYAHTWSLSTMREFTNGRELIRPAVTRFATAFLTLQSLYKQKDNLVAMFSSQKWCEGPFAKHVEGIRARSSVLFNQDFWNHVCFCIKTVIPLVSVLREVDSEERAAMGYIYQLMQLAKEKIAFNCGGVERKYKPIWNRIDARWMPQLHRPLHAAGYYLNQQLRYEDSFCNTVEVRSGLQECMKRMLSEEECLLADCQLDSYDHANGEFGSTMAIKSRKKRTPVNWWLRFGKSTPELMNFAVRVLSLTCSSSGCERNWSTFESIHTKKRNKLEPYRLNALVFVKYNTALRDRSIRRRAKVDPILVDEIDSDDEWITEIEEPVLPTDLVWLNSQELFENSLTNVPIPTYEGDSQNIESWAAPSISHNLPPVPPRPSPTINPQPTHSSPFVPSRPNLTIHPQPTHSSPHVPARPSPTIHDEATPSSPPFVASGTGYAACKRKGSASTSNNGAKRSCPSVIVNDNNENVDMEPHFDSANFPVHFDAWDEFHTEVEVDPNALSDEEGRQWNE